MQYRHFNLLVIFFSIYLCGCSTPTGSQLKKSEQLIDQTHQSTESQESKENTRKISQEKTITDDLSNQIMALNSPELIESKNSVLEHSSRLKSDIDIAIGLLEEKHGLNKHGKLKNSTNANHVNQIFIQEGKGKHLKAEIRQTQIAFMEIVDRHQLRLNQDDLPLQLNLHMERKGQSWEQYIFKDMPAIALLPILQKYKDDLILTKIIILEQLSTKD